MQNKTFHYETHDLINAFITAFDDIVISRYNKNREEKETIKVRYVYAPKERVMFDIVNKAQNITLPAVAISVNSLARDESRVFNKIYGFDAAQMVHTGNNDVLVRRHIGMPVPVNIEINMSIIANYQLDIDQIVSNFVPYNNPYVILSWKIPTGFKLSNIQEIRSEVLWGGNISYTQPIDTTGTDKFRFTADTSFTIKGWLFPSAPHDPLKNIYFINNNFYVTRMMDEEKFTGFVVGKDLEYAPLSGTPVITNMYHTVNNKVHEVFDEVILEDYNDNTLTLLGKRFEYTTQVWLSSYDTDLGMGPISSVGFDYYDPVFGYALPLSSYKVLTPNTLTVEIPKIISSSMFDIVVINEIGWASTAHKDLVIQYVV